MNFTFLVNISTSCFKHNIFNETLYVSTLRSDMKREYMKGKAGTYRELSFL